MTPASDFPCFEEKPTKPEDFNAVWQVLHSHCIFFL